MFFDRMKWNFSVLEHAQISIKEFFLQAIYNDKKFQDSQACITASVGKLEPVYAKSTVFALRKSKIFLKPNFLFLAWILFTAMPTFASGSSALTSHHVGGKVACQFVWVNGW